MNCTWPLGNGKTLEFFIFDPATTTWKALAGLYIFAGKTGPTDWTAYYVGQTEDLGSRLQNHEQWPSAVRHGATHVHTLVVPQEASRLLYEQLLIQNLQPVLNQMLK